ncbi:MAG: LysM peptidoglycan-binding domain-containing protein [Burkholderiales bacterium]|nr:LysM peptidoglycan-binding domain-containing protein [Anaerolineae bacterium]
MVTFKSTNFVGLALLVAVLALFASAALAQDTAVSEVGCVVPEGWTAYVVQPNDTLASIARVHDSSVEELSAINCITDPSVIRAGASIVIPPAPADYDHLVRRCRLAGLTTERCRALAFGDDNNIAERCRLAGLTPERCRELVSDDNNIAERCRLAGLTAERCRELVNNDNNIAERCRLAGLTPERCRELVNDAGDDDGPVIVEDVNVRVAEAADVEPIQPTGGTGESAPNSTDSRPVRGG